jgi:hypothetical protein
MTNQQTVTELTKLIKFLEQQKPMLSESAKRGADKILSELRTELAERKATKRA